MLPLPFHHQPFLPASLTQTLPPFLPPPPCSSSIYPPCIAPAERRLWSSSLSYYLTSRLALQPRRSHRTLPPYG
ncbi:hypothetical protein E2C01_091439 [Portunus trituberculatus]|uniref:Uncharacterized protein n=1 Tax=Portunus trituberculatus TaxID=210409 RepID=A0A5B7JSW5_PORTR|nr:hypothetical protein [Portunus trituberculatus]